MSYMQQAQTLPFRYDVPTSQLLQFRVDAPPFVPNQTTCPQQFQYLLPAISACIANEAAAKCGSHPGRTFLFNQLSVNNFANNDFVTAINTVVDVLLLQLYKNQIRSFEEGLVNTVSTVMGILTSLLFQNYPALQAVTPPDIVYDAKNNATMFFSLSNEILNMRNQQPHNFQMPNQQMMPNTQMNVGQNFQGNVGGFPNTFGSGIDRAMNNQPSNTPIFIQARPGNVDIKTAASGNTSGKYDYLKDSAPTRQQVMTPEPVRVTTNIQTREVQNTTLKLTDWKPSGSQYYPPSINPYTSKLIIREIIKDGQKTNILNSVRLEDVEMDRSKHVISSISQIFTSHIPEVYGTREESLEDNVDKIFRIDHEAIKAYKKDENHQEPQSQELLSYINPSWVYEGFIEPSIFSGKFQHRDHCAHDPSCSIYRVYRIIANPIICSEDHSEFIRSLSECKSFSELSVILNSTISDTTTSNSLIELCYGIEKMLTAEVNNILRNKMSIPNTTIGSFIDDINDLPSFLGNELGSEYKRIFLEFQRTYISQLIGAATDEEITNILSCVVEESTNPLVKVNFINQSYSITYLTVESHELAIEPFEDCASSVLELEHPLMYKIVTGIFNQDKDIDRECLHNLIVTSDDVIYEVQRGLIGRDIFTINLWKK